MAMSMSPGITPAQLIEEADQARTSLSQTKSFIAVLQQQRVSDEQKEESTDEAPGPELNEHTVSQQLTLENSDLKEENAKLRVELEQCQKALHQTTIELEKCQKALHQMDEDCRRAATEARELKKWASAAVELKERVLGKWGGASEKEELACGDSKEPVSLPSAGLAPADQESFLSKQKELEQTVAEMQRQRDVAQVDAL